MTFACRRAKTPQPYVQALFACLLTGGVLMQSCPAQTRTEVTVRITVRVSSDKLIVPSASAPVVVWLSPLGADGEEDPGARPGVGKSFQMVQKGKTFQPHLLVVPAGSLVAFPNRDPFFHNVFSLYNGRRFDLGLYETGASHSVPFNREGISYIFCNIHPDMGAIIVSVATPYFAVSTQSSVQLHQVPPGDYLLRTWAEDATAGSLDKATRRIKVGAEDYDAGVVDLTLQPHEPHADKFGKSYSQHPEGSPY